MERIGSPAFKLIVLLLAILSLALACPIWAQLDIPQMSGDPSCASGEWKWWANTTSHTIRKCQNGVISDVDSSEAGSGTNMGPQGDEYSPERKPDDSKMYLPCSDEFNAGETGTWTWVNQGTSTIDETTDAAILTVPSQASSERGYYCTPDNSVDWTLTAEVSYSGNLTGGTITSQGGLFAIDGGSVATPTTVVGLYLQAAGTTGNSQIFGWGQVSGYGSISGTAPNTESPGNSANRFMVLVGGQSMCLQMRYVVATKVMTFLASHNCRTFLNSFSGNTRTFSNHPLAVGFYVNSNSTGATSSLAVHWIRFRQDSDGTSGGYLPGQ